MFLENTSIENNREKLTEYLKSNYLSITPQRFYILDMIHELGSPFKATDLVNECKEEKIKI